VAKRAFGVSTHVYAVQRLRRDHLLEIGAHGFEAVEVFGARTHVDYQNPTVIADLQQWLAEARLDLFGLRIPAGAAAEDAEAALFVARRIPMRVLTIQATRPRETAKTIERLAELAEPLGVAVAVDSNSEGLSPAGSLAHYVESFETAVGVSLDCARAHQDGDLVDAIETVSEHLVAMRLPVDSRIDWPSALIAVQKVGYDGALLFELGAQGPAKAVLRRAQEARRRMERLLAP
jgi:sugar phosphate isomerase/epimerase